MPSPEKFVRGQLHKKSSLSRLRDYRQRKGIANEPLDHPIRLDQVVVTGKHHEIVESDTARLAR